MIVSVKGAELSPDSWKLKARIIFRGYNSISDEWGISAVFDELFSSSPSSLEALNTSISICLLDSHGMSILDVIKAYLQSEFKNPNHIYIILPPELNPDDKKLIQHPCAHLYKALYGHPLSSACWSLHLDSILKGLGGQEFPSLPSMYFFGNLSLILYIYIDILILSGLNIQHEGFWSSFIPLGRVLGRSHHFKLYNGVKALTLEIEDFVYQYIDLYESLPCKAIKQFRISHMDPDSLLVSGDIPYGEFSAFTARMGMKLLGLAGLSRPNILVAIPLLAAKVTIWSINKGRMAARLIGYVSHSAHYSSFYLVIFRKHYLFHSIFIPILEVACIFCEQPLHIFSSLKVQRRSRCSLGTRGDKRINHNLLLKPNLYPFHLLFSPMRYLC